MDNRAKIILVIVVICALLIVSLALAWQKLQETYIFAPVVGAAKPTIRGMKEDHAERLALWAGKAEGVPSSAPVIVFFHGSFGNMGHSSPLIELLTCFDCHVVAFDYSGYGASGGSPSTQQILEDGTLVYNYARKRWPDSEVILWGHSLGTAVATYVASNYGCRALVLMAPFYGLEELGREAGGVLRLAGSFFARLVNLLPTNEWICRVTCPVAIIHSLNDKIISYRHSLMLYEQLLAARSGGADGDFARKTLLLIPTDGNHYCVLLTEEQLTKLSDFLGIVSRGGKCLRLLEAAKASGECAS